MELQSQPLIFPQPWDSLFSLASRVLVWGLLFWIIYLLRSFFLLVFLTFVFSYIQANGVNRLEGHIKNRTARVIFTSTLFFSAITAASLFLAPKIVEQTKEFVGKVSVYLKKMDDVLLNLGDKYPPLVEIVPKLKKVQENSNGPRKWTIDQSPTLSIAAQFIGLGEEISGKNNIKLLLDNVANVGGQIASIIVSIVANFLLALLFSFLIVLDFPKLTVHFSELRNTKVSFIYEEVADSIYDFCTVLGQAFEAQFVIAVINSLLTAIGIYLLDLGEHVAFLSAIVFLCSFIPVIGVVISSIPICLLALQTSGLQLMFLAILMITFIHIIEAYILNPNIYGSRLSINPVIVLIILTVCGKLFHAWGLILGVPVFTYIFGHAIRWKEKNPNLETLSLSR